MPFAQADIAVVGGGPAGAAAAATLRTHAPSLRVVLLDGARQDRAKPGEILPAVAQSLLRQIGAWPAFLAADFLPNRGIVSAWDDEAPDERHSVFFAQGAGWQLDRQRFDALLSETAAAAGAAVHCGCAVRSAMRIRNGWRLVTCDGDVEARMVIWATGRSWRLARTFGARLTVHDQLAAYLRFFDAAPGDNRMTIEARPEGWWYSVDLPGDTRVVACLADPDSGLRDPDAWYRALRGTRLIAPLLPCSAHETTALVAPAGTVMIDPAIGDRWVAAGDTLFAADPLSSRGIVHALRSGILAAYAASDVLDGHGDRARLRYATIVAGARTGYLPAVRAHYAAAPWTTPFWQRRTAVPSQQVMR